VAEYTFGNVGAARSTTTLTTLSPGIPTGTSAGDVLFLVTKGQTNEAGLEWSVPIGWTEIGLAVSGNSSVGIQIYGGMQLWYKTAGSSESAPSVDMIGGVGFGIYRQWSTFILRYTPTSSDLVFDFVVECVDYSAAASFTGQTVTASRTATTVVFAAQAGVGGTVGASDLQGFSSQYINTNTPAFRLWDKATDAGTVNLPDLNTPTYVWMVKTFSFDRTVPPVAADEWGVGQVRW
jgi:hypothetical protein